MAKLLLIQKLQDYFSYLTAIPANMICGSRPVHGGAWTVKHSGGLVKIILAVFLKRSLFLIQERCSMSLITEKLLSGFTGLENGRPLVILPDELVHFKDWNPWNEFRGVSPLISLGLEVEQDLLAAKQNTGLLKEGGIPKGLLKTDQVLTEAEAEMLARTWDKKYGHNNKSRVAVLGKGTEYQQLTFSPDTLKLYDMKKWNLYTLLAKYGIPPRVANIQNSKSSLSGTDTDSQHRAFWNFTLIPLLQNFEQVLEVQFFRRFKLSEKGVFNLESIPELQESEDAQSNRDIAEINAGLKTINDVLKARGQEEKTWGDIWYRQSSLIPVSSNTDTGEI